MFFNALLIEDSADDAMLLQQMADDSGLPIRLTVINDAEAALEYLSAAARSGEPADLPRFVLLDLSLPKLTGFEVLREMKADEYLRDIPVIILSGTEDDDDIRQGQDLRAHTHIVKPMSRTEFRWIVESVQNYWPRLSRIRELERSA
jgi:CheY-like chemotaxis protein